MQLANLKDKKIENLLYVIFIGIILFLTFYKLGFGSFRDWDEARHGVNAYELIQNHDWLITTYGYVKDYWNLKPPLSEWLIILGYKIFGYNAIGLRIYSAFSFVLTVLLSVFFTRKYFGEKASLYTLVGFAAWKIFYGGHFVRYGDADALFTLFYVICILSLFMMWDNKKYLYIACLCVSLSFLAKSMHAGILAIVIFLAVFGSGYIKKLNWQEIIYSVLFAVLPMLLWAACRVYVDGMKFLEQMIFYDVVARSSRVIEGHVGGPHFYVREFIHNKYSIIVLLLMLVFFTLKKSKCEHKNRMLAFYAGIAVPFVLFCIVKSKFPWYTWCTYPLMLILAGAGVGYLLQTIKKPLNKILVISFLVILNVLPIAKNIKTIYHFPKDNILADEILSLVDRKQDYSKKHIYLLDKNEKHAWRQSSVIALELYGDFIAKGGGYNNFAKEKASYLLVSNSKLDKVKISYKVVSRNKNYSLIKHG